MLQIVKTPEQDYDRITRYSIAGYADDLQQIEHLEAQEALEKSQHFEKSGNPETLVNPV